MVQRSADRGERRVVHGAAELRRCSGRERAQKHVWRRLEGPVDSAALVTARCAVWSSTAAAQQKAGLPPKRLPAVLTARQLTKNAA